MQSRELIVRLIVVATGIVALITGANVGFGGIATLGLEGPGDYFTIVRADDFAVHDSHVRFVGGLWFGMGLLFLAGAIWLDKLRQAVIAGLALMVVGGIARLSASDWSVFGNPLVAFSLSAELILMPILIWQLWLGGKRSATRS